MYLVPPSLLQPHGNTPRNTPQLCLPLSQCSIPTASSNHQTPYTTFLLPNIRTKENAPPQMPPPLPRTHLQPSHQVLNYSLNFLKFCFLYHFVTEYAFDIRETAGPSSMFLFPAPFLPASPQSPPRLLPLPHVPPAPLPPPLSQTHHLTPQQCSPQSPPRATAC